MKATAKLFDKLAVSCVESRITLLVLKMLQTDDDIPVKYLKSCCCCFFFFRHMPLFKPSTTSKSPTYITFDLPLFFKDTQPNTFCPVIYLPLGASSNGTRHTGEEVHERNPPHITTSTGTYTSEPPPPLLVPPPPLCEALDCGPFDVLNAAC